MFDLMRFEVNHVIMMSGCMHGLPSRKKDDTLPKVVEEEPRKLAVVRQKPVVPSPVDNLSDDKFDDRLEQVGVLV
jgi:hypothetical protein